MKKFFLYAATAVWGKTDVAAILFFDNLAIHHRQQCK